MARASNPKSNSSENKTNPFELILLPIVFFIKIGDFTKWLLMLPWHLVDGMRISAIKYLKSVKPKPKIKKPVVKFKSQKFKKPLKKQKNYFLGFVKILKKIKLSKLPKIRIPKVKPLKISLPTPSLPKIAIPVIKFPSLPKFKFPKIKKEVKPKVKHPVKPKKFITIYPRHPLYNWQSFIMGILVTVLFILLPYNAFQFLKTLPDPHLLAQRDIEVTTKIFDRNGVLLYEIYADQNRTPLKLTEIPKNVINATIAIEDRDFYHHLGFDLKGIFRALSEIVINKRVQGGGSTITQQLIKSALLTPEVTITRKVKEIILAFWAGRIYSKDQILEMYFNQVPYGGTAWGIESASRTYFGKSARDLTLAESALLAGLPAAPTEYSPFGAHPEKAFARQTEVLRRMFEDGYITREEEQAALTEKVHFAAPKVPIRAPHFVMYVKDLLEKRYGSRMVERGGLRITTSLDINLQDKVSDIVANQVQSLKNLKVGNGAALVTNPRTGEILAMVGSKDYFNIEDEGNVNVVTSLRQPGSSIKVVNYAAALENGFTAASILDDSPVIYNQVGSAPYAPVNYDSKFHGPVPLRYALGNSYNIPAVKVLAKLGVGTMIEKGKLMGITTWEDESRYGLSLTLGGGDVTMLDMAKVFGTLADNGKRIDLMPILEVTDYTGKVLEKNQAKAGLQAVKPEVAWIISNILSDNAARTDAFGPNSSLVIPNHTVSVKTGTSNDKRDNWTIGYTPGLLAAVWVGNNNNSPMDPFLTSGITGAAPIWHDIMVEALKNKPDETMPRPVNVIELPCYFGRPEYFIKGTEPVGGRCAELVRPTPTPTP